MAKCQIRIKKKKEHGKRVCLVILEDPTFSFSFKLPDLLTRIIKKIPPEVKIGHYFITVIGEALFSSILF